MTKGICRHGKNPEHCLRCWRARERNRQYMLKSDNRDRKRDSDRLANRRRYARDREAIQAHTRAWRDANREHVNASERERRRARSSRVTEADWSLIEAAVANRSAE